MDTNTRETMLMDSEEPKGDLGDGHKTWAPQSGEQGISNRPDDEVDAVPEGDEVDDDAAFNGDDDEDDEDIDDDGDDDDGEPDEQEGAPR